MSQNQIDEIESRLDRGVLGYWYILAKASEVKSGTPTAVKALGRDLVLWRGEDGKVRCLEDYCPHRGARLSVGRQAGNTLACRYHGVVLDGDGTIVSVPGMKECALEGRRPINSYHVQERSDAIFAYFPSADAPTPSELVLPKELMGDGWSSFLCTAPWNTNYRYVLDNLSDLMHGIFLHADTFTLGRGTTQDTVAVDRTTTGFIVKRVGQQDTNLDWVEIVTEGAALHARVLIPYPPAAGPGGPMYVMTFLTPVDDRIARSSSFVRAPSNPLSSAKRGAFSFVQSSSPGHGMYWNKTVQCWKACRRTPGAAKCCTSMIWG